MLSSLLAFRRRSKLTNAIWRGQLEDASSIQAQDVSMDSAHRTYIAPAAARIRLGASDNRTNELLDREVHKLGRIILNEYTDRNDTLPVNAFEAALITRREDLALAIWDIAGPAPPSSKEKMGLSGDTPARSWSLDSYGVSSLMMAAHLGSPEFLRELAMRCPEKEWKFMGVHKGVSAWDVLESRQDQALLSAVQDGWQHPVEPGITNNRPTSSKASSPRP